MSYYQKPDSEELERLGLAIKGGYRGVNELKFLGFTGDFLSKYRLIMLLRVQRGEI